MNYGQKTDLEHVRHSLAHLLAAAVLKEFPDAKLGIGPVIENGFYYDLSFPARSRRRSERHSKKRCADMSIKNCHLRAKKFRSQKQKSVLRNNLLSWI